MFINDSVLKPKDISIWNFLYTVPNKRIYDVRHVNVQSQGCTWNVTAHNHPQAGKITKMEGGKRISDYTNVTCSSIILTTDETDHKCLL